MKTKILLPEMLGMLFTLSLLIFIYYNTIYTPQPSPSCSFQPTTTTRVFQPIMY